MDGGYGYCKWLVARGNACDFVHIAKEQGLEVTQKPTLGGMMVWSGGIGALGHVAIVEVLQGSKIKTSESEYYGAPFKVYTRQGRDWRGGCYWMNASYTYLGCIKNPAVEEDMTEAQTRKLIKEMVPDIVKETLESLKNLPADEYAVEALEWAKDQGIMIGDAKGNQMPQSPVKREDLACVLYSQEKNNG